MEIQTTGSVTPAEEVSLPDNMKFLPPDEKAEEAEPRDSNIRTQEVSTEILWGIVVVIILLLVILLAGLAAFTNFGYSAVEASKQNQVQMLTPSAPPLTLDNAPLDRIVGHLTTYGTSVQTSNTSPNGIMRLEDDDFYVIFLNGYGQKCTLSYLGGTGTWAEGDLSGPLVLHKDTRDRSHWSGEFVGQKYGKVDFSITFEVQ